MNRYTDFAKEKRKGAFVLSQQDTWLWLWQQGGDVVMHQHDTCPDGLFATQRWAFRSQQTSRAFRTLHGSAPWTSLPST